jgi:hypothetical protein
LFQLFRHYYRRKEALRGVPWRHTAALGQALGAIVRGIDVGNVSRSPRSDG